MRYIAQPALTVCVLLALAVPACDDTDMLVNGYALFKPSTSMWVITDTRTNDVVVPPLDSNASVADVTVHGHYISGTMLGSPQTWFILDTTSGEVVYYQTSLEWNEAMQGLGW